MKAYLAGVIAVSSLVSLASLFLRGKETERATKIVFGVILFTSLFLPLRDLLPELREKIVGEGTPSLPLEGDLPYCTEVGKEAFAEGVVRAVAEKFSIPREDIGIRVENFDFRSMRAEKILLTMRGRGALFDPRRIEDYVTGAGLGECEVGFEIG